MNWLKSIFNRIINFGVGSTERILTTPSGTQFNVKHNPNLAKEQEEEQDLTTSEYIQSSVLLYKLLKLTSGETLIAKVCYDMNTQDVQLDDHGQLILLEPFVLRYYNNMTPNASVVEEFFLTQWYKANTDQAIRVNGANVISTSNPTTTIVNQYNVECAKADIYTKNPHVGQHLFELTVIGKPSDDRNGGYHDGYPD